MSIVEKIQSNNMSLGKRINQNQRITRGMNNTAGDLSIL